MPSSSESSGAAYGPDPDRCAATDPAAGRPLIGPHEPHDEALSGSGEVPDGSLVVSATTPADGVVVVRAVGELDLLTAPLWRRALEAALPLLGPRAPQRPDVPGGTPAEPVRDRPSRLVCDLSAVTFIGATGLGVLLDLARQAGEQDVELCAVVDGRGPVRRLLELLGVDREIGLYRKLADAVSITPPAGAAA